MQPVLARGGEDMYFGRVCFSDELGRPRSVCEVYLVPYEDEVVAVAVMHALLFVFHVYMLRECEGARVTSMLVWGMVEVRLCRAWVCG